MAGLKSMASDGPIENHAITAVANDHIFTFIIPLSTVLTSHDSLADVMATRGSV